MSAHYPTHAKGTRYLYGVFIGSRWCMVTTRKEADRVFGGRKAIGLPREIHRLREAPYRNERGVGSFDAPTFRVRQSTGREIAMSRANPATTHQYAGIAAWNVKLRAEIHSYAACRTVQS